MASYNLREIAQATDGVLQGNPEVVITDLAYDSRNLVAPRSSVFFALQSAKNDGHNYVKDAYNKGVRAFVVQESFSSDIAASFIRVPDTLVALQCLSEYHRKSIAYPIIGITGSNGKTTVKEWLTQVLKTEKSVSSSPRSFNSQLGVPLSLWSFKRTHDIGIIEAGISQPNEMEKLAAIIQPELGIFTHLGDAHLSNFTSTEELISEKIKLFKSCKNVIIQDSETAVISALEDAKIPLITWGTSESNTVQIQTEIQTHQAVFTVNYNGNQLHLTCGLTDNASLENCGHVITAALITGISAESIQREISRLKPLDMRIQVMKGVNNCVLINDSYTADISALENALDHANKYVFERSKTLVISDFSDGETAHPQIEKLIAEKGVSRLLTIGIHSKALHTSVSDSAHFNSVKELLEAELNFRNEVIIIKGARSFQLEKVAQRLQLQDHQTVLEINLNAFTENLEFYRTKLRPETKIMAMVKAFSYGAGSFEVASHLQNLGVNYLAVAYTDEGVELRKNGISIPILVLNPEPSSFDSIIRYQLEPEIYSVKLLDEFLAALDAYGQTSFPIHIKIDSGMHRLGMGAHEITDVLPQLQTDKVEVISIFSHLAASDDKNHDEFTKNQIKVFEEVSGEICNALPNNPLRHICNSAAISRFPEAHFDMVRLGIGLYGVSSIQKEQSSLTLAGKLKTQIIQVRKLKKGESIGYNRGFTAEEDTRVGIIPIGYADGLFRSMGNGKIEVTIGKQKAQIIGILCMDMCFINLTEIDTAVDSEVIIFQNINDLKSMSRAAETIPYEILSAISHRVKRNFFIE